ncbi:MAG: zinc ribbon domain-containing protein [Deltaproteobacteria bacterium]|nr:zinc ribbon domain-containing protein [Deltaproteobacteria bacterium]
MNCPKCRTENQEARKFCRKCGAKLILACPQCGFENLPEDLFCSECGQDLRASKRPNPIDYEQPYSYTPKHLAEKILNTRGTLEGERKLVTVMFADVAGFTALSEKQDPEDVHRIRYGIDFSRGDVVH